MRLIATSDLHYNIARSREPTERLARDLAGRGDLDALVIVGDIAGAEKEHFDRCLALFADLPGRKFFVAGNHSLWSSDGTDALRLLADDLPARGRRQGFACLEYEPAVVGPVALVGTVGWYDYSFRHEELAVPMRFYRSKVAPGAARYFREHRELLARTDDLADEHHRMVTRWMDGVHVALAMGDEAFTRLLADKLARQLDEVAPRVDRIVVFIHHVPFANMMPQWPSEQWRFVAAYMGSERFGQVCLAQPKVTHVLCGHTHQAVQVRNGRIECHGIGSNYIHKRTVELEL
jgi:predicted phosphohydrolase